MTGASFDEIARELLTAERIAISGHVHPDGDALGSVLALGTALLALGKRVDLLLADDRKPALYDFLPGIEGFKQATDYGDTPDLFVALDTPTTDRLGASFDCLKRARRSLAIDHHPDHAGYADVWMFDSDASAAGEIIWELIPQLGMAPTPDIALCCYVAVMTDTGRFQYQNVTPKTFALASQMLKAGVLPEYAAERVYQNRSLGTAKLEARVMERVILADDGRAAISWVSNDDFSELGVGKDDTEALPDLLRGLKGVQVCCLLRDEGAEIRGSLRAKGNRTIGHVARSLGGGGHDAAAGFTVKGKPVGDVIEMVMPMLAADAAAACEVE